MGTKDSVLVFRTCVLSHNESCSSEDDLCNASSQTKLKDSQQPTCSSKILEPKNINVSKNESTAASKAYTFSEKSFKKRSHDSLSSSDNSISSACDDPNEIEADILKASQNLDENDEDDERGGATTKNTQSISMKESIDNEKENITDETAVDVADMPAAILKITYKFINTETKLLRKILSSHGLREAEENQQFNLLWTGVHIKPDILRNLTPYQRVNHFPR